MKKVRIDKLNINELKNSILVKLLNKTSKISKKYNNKFFLLFIVELVLHYQIINP